MWCEPYSDLEAVQRPRHKNNNSFNVVSLTDHGNLMALNPKYDTCTYEHYSAIT